MWKACLLRTYPLPCPSVCYCLLLPLLVRIYVRGSEICGVMVCVTRLESTKRPSKGPLRGLQFEKTRKCESGEVDWWGTAVQGCHWVIFTVPPPIN